MSGWFSTPTTDIPKPLVVGWWSALDLNGVISIQFVTHAELQALKQMNMVLAVSVNRSAVLAAVRTMVLTRGLNVTINLGLNGIYFLSLDRLETVDRSLSLSNVRQMNFPQQITFNTAMQLGHVLDLGATNELWTVGASASLQHIVPINTPVQISFNRAASLLPIYVQDFAASLSVNTSMDLTLIPNFASYSDDFNRANSATPGADWRLDRGTSPQIISNLLQGAAMGGTTSRRGGWVSYQGGANSGRFNTDNYSVTAQMASPSPSGNAEATDNPSCIVLAVGDTFGSGVMCYFATFRSSGTGSTQGCKILTCTTPPTSGVSTGQTGESVQATNNTLIGATDVVEFRRQGNVFTVNRNGSFLFSWTDSANIVASGPSNRRWGLVVEGNRPAFQQAWFSPAFDSVSATDI
jgi:hypothetical protein